MTGIRVLAMATLALLPAAVHAQTAVWEIDSAHSHVGFSVRHMMVSNVKGEFKKFTVKVRTETDLTKSTVEATIDVASLTTGNEKRDGHLKSPDFFDAAKYPTITFKSKKIAKDGKGFKVTGDLTMKGKTREVVLAVKSLVGPVKDMMGGSRRGFDAAAKLDRRDFGLTWNKALDGGGVLVGNEVAIDLQGALTQK
jgi:polyisoprenoid-binding protein YceI